MRAKFNVDIRPALKGIQRLEEAVHTQAVGEGLEAVAKVATDKARKTTHFKDRTGATRRTFKARQKLVKGRPVGQFHSSTPKTYWLEKGTKKMKDRKPFIVPAAETTTDDQLKAMGRVFEKYIAKISTGELKTI